MRFGPLEPTGILRVVEVNTIGPLLATRAVVERLSASERGRVVSVSSWLGSIERKQSGGNDGCCASKATLNMLTCAAAFDLAECGIVSVVVNPGWVSTDMGGSRAHLTPEQSMPGLVSLTDTFTPSHAGGFFQWDGSEYAW